MVKYLAVTRLLDKLSAPGIFIHEVRFGPWQNNLGAELPPKLRSKKLVGLLPTESALIQPWHWQHGALSTGRTAGHDDNSSGGDVVTNAIMR